MAKKLFIVLQKPTIELELIAKDSAKQTDRFIVGFNRYTIEQADPKFKEFSELLNAVTDKDSAELVSKFIKSEIQYLKAVGLEYEEDGKNKKLHITDTREAKPFEGLWETPDECLDVLLDMYLGSAPYRLSFIENLSKAFVNRDFEEDKIKNL
jgi:hypothetical protein